MIKQIKKALNAITHLSDDTAIIAKGVQGCLKHLQQPSALEPMQIKLDAMDAQLAAIVGQAEEILHQAIRERKDARNAEERTRNAEKRLNEATEDFRGATESPIGEPEYFDDLPQIDGEASEGNGLHHVRDRLEARSDAKKRAREHKYR